MDRVRCLSGASMTGAKFLPANQWLEGMIERLGAN
jgi:hypothetical protein